MVESYIISIYRKDRKNPRILVGVVEGHGIEGKKAFHNIEDLWSILSPSESRPSWKGPVKGKGEKANNKEYKT